MRSAILCAAMLFLGAGAASANCGIPPISPVPPVGCSSVVPVCTCNYSGRCWWTFQCIRY